MSYATNLSRSNARMADSSSRLSNATDIPSAEQNTTISQLYYHGKKQKHETWLNGEKPGIGVNREHL